MKKRNIMFFIIMFAVFLPISALSITFENLMIVKIELKGNINTDSTLIKAQLSSKVGGKFSLKTISKDVKDLYFLGYFTDIKVDAKRLAGGVIVTFIFSEYEKVEKIIIKGNDELDDDDIKEIMTIKKDSVYNKILLNQNIEKIIKKYKEKGYINAQVVPQIKINRKSQKAVILLKVKEGKKIVIEEINVVGAKQLDAKSVKGAIEDTHESSLFRSGIFNKDEFEKDKKRIINYYHDRGFINMTIKSVDFKIKRIKPKKPKKAIYIYINVVEGKRYKMGKYVFEGNDVYNRKYILQKIFRQKEGAFFNSTQYKKDMMSLWNAYREKGYIFANIVPMKTVDEKKLLVNVKFKIFESQKAHIESIKIKGTTRTKNYVVKREIRVKEGQIFNSALIRRSQERLFNLRFFKDVNIEIEPGSTEGLMKLIFSLKEDRTGLFTLGAGYGSVSGFTFYEQISENNFLGRGLKIHERVELGKKRQSVQLGIDTPYLFKYNPTSLGFSVSYNRGKIEDISTNYVSSPTNKDYYYWKKSFDISLRGGRTLSEYWRTYVSYTWSWIDTYDANFNVITNGDPRLDSMDEDETNAAFNLREALSKGFIKKSSLRLGLIFDTRDYVAGPSRGVYFSQFFTYTGGIIGGDSDYILSDSNFSFFIPLMWNFVFAVDTKFEFLLNQFGGKSKIYQSDLLTFDGMTELRGWRGAYDDDGRSKVAALVELRYPINKRMLWGVLFYDIGRVWSGYNDINFDFKKYKHSIGFGFRLQMAVLPIRLYFAKRFEYDDKGKFHWLGGDGKFFGGWETVFSVAGVF